MFLLDSATAGSPPDLVFSASDLVAASECEYRTLRILDEKLGRAPKAVFASDEMQIRAGTLGDQHELTVLASLTNKYGLWNEDRAAGVYSVERGPNTRVELRARHAETEQALRAGADVVFQATFFDGEFLGYADFLVNENAGLGNPGRYEVWDTKLARHAKVGALLQLAAYGDQLLGMGLSPSPTVTLVLGTRVGDDWLRSPHALPDLLPAFRERRRRFRHLIAAHRAGDVAAQWQQAGVVHCGRCNYCAEQVQLHRDLLMVAGMSTVRRRKLHGDGISTIDDLAAMPEADAHGSVARLRAQARMQLQLDPPHGSRTLLKDGQPHTVSYAVLAGNSISELPPPSPGDIFFDFEGDPLWQDPAGVWGIEYLFGVIEAPVPGDAGEPVFRPFWAHSRSGERQAFLDFLAYVEERRARFPDMHVYHYAAYEKSALRNLSLAHQAGEDTVDQWLRAGLLVDLYATVRHSLRISEASYSIKKLEPLYMGEHLRSGEVKDAGASVVAYAAYCAERDAGHAAAAARVLESIADYNLYDCLSTLRLRDWLRSLVHPRADASGHPGVGPAGHPGVEATGRSDADDGGTSLGASAVGASAGEASGRGSDAAVAAAAASAAVGPAQNPAETTLHDYLSGLPDGPPLTGDQRAVALVAAATGYHRRERKQFWWQHFDRAESPIDSWPDQRNVFVVAAAQVVSDWALAKPRERMRTRVLRLVGTMTEGSDFRPGSKWCRLYDAPGPHGMAGEDSLPGAKPYTFGTQIGAVEALPDQPGHAALTIAERETGKVSAYQDFPVALTEDQPIMTASIEAALGTIAEKVAASLPELPAQPGLDVLRKRPPRFRNLPGPVPVTHTPDGAADYAAAITASLRDLDQSYLAVQGPPGTGKTYVGAHVIGRLVTAGWKVGVVGQSHSVVENLLSRAIDTGGVDPAVVAKKIVGTPDAPWSRTADGDVAKLLSGSGGCLVGGTAWTMTGKEVPAGALDLLVIDEAGQFSLANTLAVSVAARRLLLLGDPQQLPQVSQGAHPEPVDESALGWLAAGHATLPANLGYFLADTWRLHPALCSAISVLSYDGKLQSAPAASERDLADLPPGVETVFVDHAGNTVSSIEEAAEVVRQVQRHLGLTWTSGPCEAARALEPEDVLVVAAYNAQVQLVRAYLDVAGLAGVRVGTVDKFQGQEAPVVLMSMACSAVAEAPRGAEFLLNRNRINVAVSRGQWRAVIIRSPELTSYMPHRPVGLEELGAFLGLSPRLD
ncbi:TM0106 family RecB-like putative nuclease [Arthrobacter ulcerisalmonis]|uniref:TM0106 family RecB-like putative nuclease n=1 Tax=Arthrobacter ulcerisalmonis TaxID=2483813 RepID=UPI000F54BC88|nr:TM0106 family RecB-like putative nuclease [Arthrobacter ulcerisalmonis]